MTVNDLKVLVENLDEYIHIPSGIERLKKTVLNLAVSGQLVPQDLREGTAEDLYKKIQARHFIKKPIAEVADDEKLFNIPSSWKWVRPVAIGKTNPRNTLPDDTEVGFIPMSCISENYGIAPQYKKRIWKDVKKNLTHIATGDVVLAKITPCFENSKAGIIGHLPNQVGAATTEVHVFRQDDNLVNHMYFYIWLKTPTYLKVGQSMMTGTAGQKRIPTDFFASFAMPLPPYSEQQRIVKRVDEIFSLIDALEKKYRTEETERSKLVKSSLRVLSQEGSKLALDNLTGIIKTKADAAELRKAILQLAVSGKLVPQDPKEGTGGELLKQIQTENSKFNQKKQKQLSEITDEELPFSIPRSWKWVRIGKLSDIFNGNSISKSEKALKYENVTDGYPYLGTKDIGYGFQKIDYENGVCIPFNELKFKVIAAGTVLICSEGGSAGKKCGIVDREVCFGNKMYAFKAYGDIVLPEFILYNYLTDKFFSQFKNKMTGIIGGISSTKFKELLIPLPPLSEQKRIIQKTSELLSLIEELEISLE
jgi:type I restriction enzyme S subunit